MFAVLCISLVASNDVQFCTSLQCTCRRSSCNTHCHCFAIPSAALLLCTAITIVHTCSPSSSMQCSLSMRQLPLSDAVADVFCTHQCPFIPLHNLSGNIRISNIYHLLHLSRAVVDTMALQSASNAMPGNDAMQQLHKYYALTCLA